MTLKVSILGSGELGATIAQKLAAADWPGEVLLLDTREGPSQGRGLDLLQSNPVVQSCTKVRGTHILDELEGSSFVILADYGFPDRPLERTEDARRILQSVTRQAPESVLLTTHFDLGLTLSIAHNVWKHPAARLVGVAPCALVSVWGHYLAQAAGCSSSSVSISLVGAPPGRSLYAVFAAIEGVPVERVLNPASLQFVHRRMESRGNPGPRTLASAAVAVLRDMVEKRGAVRSCFSWSEGVYGAREQFLCAPTLLSETGAVRVFEIPLEPAERVQVDRGLDALARAQGAPR